MTTDKKLKQLIINKLTKEQFDSATVSPAEQYFITDDDYFATKTDLVTKQDKLTSANAGNNISITESGGKVIISSTGGAIPEIDRLTISTTSDNKLQAEGTVLQSGSYQKYWEGSKAQFNAIANKDDNTLYQVLDDEETALFEVDGTTIEFSDDKILQIPSNIDFVILEQTWGDGESGLIQYRNGRMEMWGKATSDANGETEFRMHSPFKDLNYSIFASTAELGNYFVSCYPSTTQNFKLRIQSSNNTNMAVKFMWRAYGYYK